MAIYHLTVKTLGRAKNEKAVAAAAYRSGSKLKDERYATTHDYTKRKGIAHTEILTPDGVPDWAHDRERLWNEVEKSEKRKDSQVAREVEFALPRELPAAECRELARRFISEEMTNRGMVADLAIHDRSASDGGRNPHAHVLLTMRRLGPDGFGPKEREWNQTELVETWRERWAAACNEALAAAGEDARIDHRTLEQQGIMREPTVHLGKDAFHAAEKGRVVDRVERQPGMVERALAPYTEQIEEQGSIEMTMTPEAGQTWWERTAAFTQRVSERVQEWYGRTREAVQSWVQRVRPDGPEPEQSRTR